MLTKGDDYPIHQTPEPIAFSGTDRNFYDRYFFNGYRQDGSGFFAVAFGVYPHLNVADAHVSVLRDGKQISLHASRELNMERMDLSVGPIAIDVVEPLHRLKIAIDSGEGVRGELVCEGRSFPVQEPRFTRRNGPRLLMDLTRFTQAVRWSGWIEIDGKREEYSAASTYGVRDRSWGVRPIGAADAQPMAPPMSPQFYWLWAPTNFPNVALYYHVNQDAEGLAWNERCTLAPDGVDAHGQVHLHEPRIHMTWAHGKRWASEMLLQVKDPSGRDHVVRWTPLSTFLMKGIGYSHPEWGHGAYKGRLSVAREDFDPAALDPLAPMHLHIQAICAARHEGPGGLAADGVGAFEQLVIGPHAPSNFKSVLDGAA